MSKVVKAVGNAVKSVVKGVTNVVKNVAKGVGNLAKSIASSKLGKVLLVAAAVYFGGAALSGGFGASASGGSFLSGMGTGVANAASSLQTAWGSVMSGNFSTAGSQLAQGFSGEVAGANMAAAPAGAMTTAPVTDYSLASTSGGPASAAGAPGSVGAGGVNVTTAPSTLGGNIGTNPMVSGQGSMLAGSTPSAAPPSMWDKVISSPYTAPAAISAGTQVVGGLIQGAGQKKAMEDQREYEERMAREARDRYNANAGASLWSSNQPVNEATGAPAAAAWDPTAEARAINARYAYNPTAPATSGLVARYMPQQPNANGYPTYNPYYANRAA